MNKWLRINTHPCLPLGPDGRRISECKKHTDFSRKAACEGMVLLKISIIPYLSKPLQGLQYSAPVKSTM